MTGSYTIDCSLISRILPSTFCLLAFPKSILSSTIMYTFSNILMLNLFLPILSTTLSIRELNDPVAEYLFDICYPLYSNTTRRIELQLTGNEIYASLANSPLPCEQGIYIQAVCTATGTTELDLLAEQECLCEGAYWEALQGCANCYHAHGYQGSTPSEASSSIARLSRAECSPTPPSQPFSNLLPAVNVTSVENSPPLTLGTDRAPNNTAIDIYFTATLSMMPGQVTGSATGQLTSLVNSPVSGTGIAITNTTPTALSSSRTSTSLIPTASKGIAMVAEAQITCSLLSAVLSLAIPL